MHYRVSDPSVSRMARKMRGLFYGVCIASPDRNGFRLLPVMIFVGEGKLFSFIAFCLSACFGL